MKLFLFVFIFLLAFASVKAQNIQLHYVLDGGGAYYTSTVEMFRPDKWGSTFFFVDMDYNVGGVTGVGMAYWEIARAIGLGDFPLSFHLEYNGGLGKYVADNELKAYTINDAWLVGAEHSWNAKDYSKGLTLQGLYKYIRDKHNASFQLTAVWYWNMFDNKFSLTGYADWWREDFMFGEKLTKFSFLAEPQAWYNFTGNIAVGTEIELSSNVYNLKFLHVVPSIAAKVTF